MIRSRVKMLALIAPAVLLAACGGEESPGRNGPPASAAEADAQEVDRLRALGYLDVAAPLAEGDRAGVLLHDRERAAPGLSFFTSARTCASQLIDMEGQVLHSWSHQPCWLWGNALLLPDGSIVVLGREPHERTGHESLAKALYLLRLSWEGEVQWKIPLTSHHDVALAPDGSIVTLTYRHEILPDIHPEVPTRNELVVTVSPEGEILEEVSLHELMTSAPEVLELREIEPREHEGLTEVDVFHSNMIEFMSQPHLVGRHPIYDPGKALICLRNQDAIVVVDWEERKLLWAWGPGELSGPHDATVLPSGNILLFDNGLGRDWSRVLELDPVSGRIVWEYGGPGESSFYTRSRGANQRLGNGNTLIVESDDGRAFEVTPEGRIVWEFINPNMTKKREPSVIVRMRRYEGLDFEGFRDAAREGRLPMMD